MKALWLEHGGQYRHHDENMMFSIGIVTRTWCPAQASWLEHPRLCARQFAALQGAQVCRLLYWTCWFRYVILMERAGFLQFLWRCWNPDITGVSSCKKKKYLNLTKNINQNVWVRVVQTTLLMLVLWFACLMKAKIHLYGLIRASWCVQWNICTVLEDYCSFMDLHLLLCTFVEVGRCYPHPSWLLGADLWIRFPQHRVLLKI